MAELKEFYISGIEKLEYAPASELGVIAENAWKLIENITENSVKYTETPLSKTSLNAEDKDIAPVNFYAPAEGDVLTLGVLATNPTLLGDLYYLDYVAATTTIHFEDTKKIANLAFRITSRPTNGKKTIRTYYNTEVQTATDGNQTRTDVEKKVLTATLKTYTPAGKTKRFTHSLQVVNPDGTVINSTVA